MKTCPNCRVVHADEYNGQCQECGAPMGGVQSASQNGLQFDYARQVAASQQENRQEQAMRRGNYDGVKINDSILDVARGFVTVDEEKLRAAQE